MTANFDNVDFLLNILSSLFLLQSSVFIVTNPLRKNYIIVKFYITIKYRAYTLSINPTYNGLLKTMGDGYLARFKNH